MENTRNYLYIVLLSFAVIFLDGCAVTKPDLKQNNEEKQEVPFVVITEVDTATAEISDSITTVAVTLSEMVSDAENLCSDAQFYAADSVLREVLRVIGNLNSEAELPDSEYVTRMVKIYTEVMPPNFPIPEEIAVTVFQRQMFMSLDSIKLLPGDTIDLEKLMCRKDIIYNVPVVWNERVQRAVNYYLSSRKETINNWVSRSGYYLPFMQKMFADSGLPTDLAFLPLIESGFNPKAYSHAHASGIWQFISSTGKVYGLRNNYWLDERRDPIKSTVAAIRYLKKLYSQFGDWHLALAAYNCGEGGLGRAMVRCSTSDYWSLTLASETMNYVPLYLAALTIAKNPECFGYTKAVTDTFSFDTVSVNECIDLKDIAEGVGVPLDTIRKINPHILHWCTPPDMSGVLLYLPVGHKEPFNTFIANLPDEKRVKWYRYTIKKGDNIGAIARKFGVPAEPIRTVNRLKNNRIVAGKHLFIPIPAKGISEQVLEKLEYKEDENEIKSRSGSGDTIKYRVKQGDTLWRLSELFNVSTEEICRWNGINEKSQIKADQVLTIYKGKTVTKRSAGKTEDKDGRYLVQAGDTPTSIAQKFNISISRLIELNGLDSEKPVIYSGNTLIVEGQPKQEKKPPSESRVSKGNLPENPSSDEFISYQVSEGDNLYRISQNFSIPIESLLSANNLQKNSVIRIGNILMIPRDGKKNYEHNDAQNYVFYEVKAGDTFWGIANSFGIPIEKIYEHNELSSDSVLRPGDTIKVVKAVGQ
ncbi:MAG: LysM peptidoglycan-binding domain-containing protein [Fibrobacter sp.]|nr:LysM peptidoglycan-binding domain-containing protein [Fibrobacter sp.]